MESECFKNVLLTILTENRVMNMITACCMQKLHGTTAHEATTLAGRQPVCAFSYSEVE